MSLKFNSDIAIFPDINVAGYGWVLHDSTGSFIVCGMNLLSGLNSVRESEAIGLFKGCHGFARWGLST